MQKNTSKTSHRVSSKLDKPMPDSLVLDQSASNSRLTIESRKFSKGKLGSKKTVKNINDPKERMTGSVMKTYTSQRDKAIDLNSSKRSRHNLSHSKSHE